MALFLQGPKTKMLYGVIAFSVLFVAGSIWILKAKKRAYVVVCAGDSFTASGYPEKLQKEFNGTGMTAIVINRGINGHTSGEYLNFMKRNDIFKLDNPDAVLLMLGTNDVRVDRDFTKTDDFIKNMEEIISLIKRYPNNKGKTPDILISTILPIPDNPPSTFNQQSIQRVKNEINPAIETIAEKHALILVDNYRLFSEHMNLLSNIHPTQEGYELMAENWYRHLAGVFKGL